MSFYKNYVIWYNFYEEKAIEINQELIDQISELNIERSKLKNKRKIDYNLMHTKEDKINELRLRQWENKHVLRKEIWLPFDNKNFNNFLQYYKYSISI